MLLLAFSQRDVAFLTDVSLSLAGAGNRPDVDVEGFREALGILMARYQGLSLQEMQMGAVLQEMTEISLRYEVPLPTSLTLSGKAMSQMQLVTAALDPELDPFEVASSYLLHQGTSSVRGQLNAQSSSTKRKSSRCASRDSSSLSKGSPARGQGRSYRSTSARNDSRRPWRGSADCWLSRSSRGWRCWARR